MNWYCKGKFCLADKKYLVLEQSSPHKASPVCHLHHFGAALWSRIMDSDLILNKEAGCSPSVVLEEYHSNAPVELVMRVGVRSKY